MLPISLYIHIPWCVKKCPYCDFNSHAQKGELPETDYINALLDDLHQTLAQYPPLPLHSIFIGGGTPSLFSAKSYEFLLLELKKYFIFEHIEITLEANPESISLEKFIDYKAAGINRISIGIQSFNNTHLGLLGRAHNAEQAQYAIEHVFNAGFDNVNIDLMFGLPEQSINDALVDLKTALQYPITHLSWYQLTLEPNTPFYQRPPILPSGDRIFEMQVEGQALLKAHGFSQYEVSAYTKNTPCQHNMNYWQFGDYIGIGCGAHSKFKQERSIKIKHPKMYLEAYKNNTNYINHTESIENHIIFEFMLNALRLTNGFSFALFEERTGLPWQRIDKQIHEAIAKKLITINTKTHQLQPTPHGYLFLNDLISIFL